MGIKTRKIICKVCKKEHNSYYSSKGIYCSNACQKVDQQKAFENLQTDSSRRKRLIKETGTACWICGISEWQGLPLNVELDHIDGNHTNNNRNNLRLICPNCHSQTPTYKNRNKGNGRTKRRNSLSSKTAPL